MQLFEECLLVCLSHKLLNVHLPTVKLYYLEFDLRQYKLSRGFYILLTNGRGLSTARFMASHVPENELVSSRLKQARLQCGLTLEAAGEKAGIDYTTVWRYEAGQRRPGGIPLFKLAQVYGKSVDWFWEGGDSEEDPGEESETGVVDKPEQSFLPVAHDRLELITRALISTARTHDVSLDYLFGLTDDPTPAAQRSEVIHTFTPTMPSLELLNEGNDDGSLDRRPVEVLEVAGAGGVGAEVYDETPVGLLWFRNDWLKRHSIDPMQSNIITVRGESMEPTLPDGCSILVDKQRRTPLEGRIYVMRTEEGLVVKRLDRDEMGRWAIVSDNPDWDPVPMLYGTDIVGEVRWSAVTH